MLQRLAGGRGQFADRANAPVRQLSFGDRTHAPHQLDWERMEEIQFVFGWYHDHPVGFGNLRCDLGEVLRSCHADRYRQACLLPYPAADLGCTLRPSQKRS